MPKSICSPIFCMLRSLYTLSSEVLRKKLAKAVKKGQAYGRFWCAWSKFGRGKNRKMKSAHALGISNNISSKTCSYMIYLMHCEMAYSVSLFSISSSMLNDGIVLYRLRNHRKHYHHYCRQLNLLISFGSYNKYQLKAKGIRGGYICA